MGGFVVLIATWLSVFFVSVSKMNDSGQKYKMSHCQVLSHFISGMTMVCLSLGCHDVSTGVPRNLKIQKSPQQARKVLI